MKYEISVCDFCGRHGTEKNFTDKAVVIVCAPLCRTPGEWRMDLCERCANRVLTGVSDAIQKLKTQGSEKA